MKFNPHLAIAVILLLATIAGFAIWPDSQIKWLLLGLFIAFALNTTLNRKKQ